MEHDGDEVCMVLLSPDAQTRRDQKFVRKVVIGDPKCGTLQEGKAKVLMSSSSKICFQQRRLFIFGCHFRTRK